MLNTFFLIGINTLVFINDFTIGVNVDFRRRVALKFFRNCARIFGEITLLTGCSVGGGLLASRDE